MKQHNDNIEAEISKTMQVMDEMQPLKVDHLFRARLMQRIEREETQQQSRKNLVWHVDYKLAVLTLLFIINLGSALMSKPQQTSQSATTISAISDNQSNEYATQEFAYYDQTALYEEPAPWVSALFNEKITIKTEEKR